jgi:hypothetical protein
MTDAEKVTILLTALDAADRKLELILGEPPPRVDEHAATVAMGVRRILQNALKRIEKGTPYPHTDPAGIRHAKTAPAPKPQAVRFAAWQKTTLTKELKP